MRKYRYKKQIIAFAVRFGFAAVYVNKVGRLREGKK